MEYKDSVFKPTLPDNLSKRTKFLKYMDSVFVYMTFIRGQNKGSKRGILVEQRGHGATNKDDYKDQARWSSPSIQDFGNLLKSEVYIWTSDHGRWIDSKHILMAHNRRFPHSHEISSYLNESTVMGTDWVTIMEHMRLWRTYSFLLFCLLISSMDSFWVNIFLLLLVCLFGFFV